MPLPFEYVFAGDKVYLSEGIFKNARLTLSHLIENRTPSRIFSGAMTIATFFRDHFATDKGMVLSAYSALSRPEVPVTVHGAELAVRYSQGLLGECDLYPQIESKIHVIAEQMDANLLREIHQETKADVHFVKEKAEAMEQEVVILIRGGTQRLLDEIEDDLLSKGNRKFW